MAHMYTYHYLHSYVHNGRIGVLVEIGCESDFTTRMEPFHAFVHDMALQIAAMAPGDVDALLAQTFVKDPSKTIRAFVEEASGQFRERIAVTRSIRWSVGDREHPEEPTTPRTPAVILSFRRNV